MAGPLVIAGAVAKSTGLLGKLGGLLDSHPEDKTRLQRNQWLYEMALNGDRQAYYALGLLSRRVASPEPNGYRAGPLPDGWITSAPAGKKWNGKDWGWATQKAADDAFKKYQAVAAKFAGASSSLPTVPPIPNVGNGSVNVDPNRGDGNSIVPAGLTDTLDTVQASIGGNLLWWVVGGGILAVVGHRYKWWGR